jgi:hypothetical protein
LLSLDHKVNNATGAKKCKKGIDKQVTYRVSQAACSLVA